MDCFLLSVRSVALATTTKVSQRGGISNLDLAVERGNGVMSSPRQGGRVARQHVNDLQKSMIRALRGLRESPAFLMCLPNESASSVRGEYPFFAPSIKHISIPSHHRSVSRVDRRSSFSSRNTDQCVFNTSLGASVEILHFFKYRYS
jgi:hypothetical protein